MSHVNKKPLARKRNLVQTKLSLERTMNGLEKPPKKIRSKKSKSKKESEIL